MKTIIVLEGDVDCAQAWAYATMARDRGCLIESDPDHDSLAFMRHKLNDSNKLPPLSVFLHSPAQRLLQLSKREDGYCMFTGHRLLDKVENQLFNLNAETIVFPVSGLSANPEAMRVMIALDTGCHFGKLIRPGNEHGADLFLKHYERAHAKVQR